MTFWDHLDVLRALLLRCLAVTLVCAAVAFCFRDEIFAVVLAPQHSDFFTYRLFAALGAPVPDFHVSLINTALAQQFIVHMQVSMAIGVAVASPWWVFELIRFVLPALYSHERRAALPAFAAGYLMFIVGIAVSYFILFPLTFRFLGTYQVSADVPNCITLSSYISTLCSLSLAMGLVFELPVVCWILGRFGVLHASMLRSVRRQAMVVILIAAAIITPTGDAFTLLIVSLPVWLLYETSILLLPEKQRFR